MPRKTHLHDRLDILLNNAGIMMVLYGVSEDGFERQFTTNHLGHFALTGLLMDLITNTPGARVVNVSSNAHRFGQIPDAYRWPRLWSSRFIWSIQIS
jgi:NAD(P)-dependent dehydrogenase (short-subunit alcohol dehydrogenase family)